MPCHGAPQRRKPRGCLRTKCTTLLRSFRGKMWAFQFEAFQINQTMKTSYYSLSEEATEREGEREREGWGASWRLVEVWVIGLISMSLLNLHHSAFASAGSCWRFRCPLAVHLDTFHSVAVACPPSAFEDIPVCGCSNGSTGRQTEEVSTWASVRLTRSTWGCGTSWNGETLKGHEAQHMYA